MSKKMWYKFIALALALVLTVPILAACGIENKKIPTLPSLVFQAPQQNTGEIWVDDLTYETGANGEPIVLVSNPKATDPTRAQLFGFIKSDQTDSLVYDPSTRVCADFAELLYNNAEASGIRAAFVVLQSVNHAINAFETTDEGLIFIDCTGALEGTPQTVHSSSTTEHGSTSSNDKVAYIQEGQPLGFISLDSSTHYGYQYSAYEEWKQDRAQLDSLHSEYSTEVGGKSVVPQEEYNKLQQILYQETSLSAKLGGFWQEEGTVTGYQLFWKGK